MSEIHWTKEQSDAIVADGHTMLAANAGTGKTTTVIGKVMWHLGHPIGRIEKTGQPLAPCPPYRAASLAQIAAITFTEKAAYDLKRKLRGELEAHAPHLVWDIDRAAIGTIHHFCGSLLREHALRFGIDPGFRILDERDARLEQDRICKDVCMEALSDRNPHIVAVTQRATLEGFQYKDGLIDFVRRAFRDVRWHADRYPTWCAGGRLDRYAVERLAGTWSAPDDIPFAQTAAIVELAMEAERRWHAFEDEDNVRDFDSIILTVRDILTTEVGAAALAGIRRRFQLLIIDEFQDTDAAQRDIAFAIAGIGDESNAPSGPELFVVGDPKQSIYRFRGADVHVWNEVHRRIGGDGTPRKLTTNFRSDPAVIDFVNGVCNPVLSQQAAAVEHVAPGGGVGYDALAAGRDPIGSAEVEWLETPSGLTKDPRRTAEALRVAARIRDVVFDRALGDEDGIEIVDPDDGERRECKYRDIAILFRRREGIEEYARALQRYGVPYFLAGDAGLVQRQEILDLLTLLRVIDNPRDDLHVFAILRSPFVGLRDETVARIRFAGTGSTLLRQARQFVQDHQEWSPFEERPDVEAIERQSLRTGIALLDDLIAMRTRVPVDRLVEEALQRSGYRLHLLLLDQPAPRLANVQRFVRLLQGYRHHTVGSFLELWAQWEDQELGIPQAPLYSKKDDVVTLSTIHGAKGLEWPVVFLADTQSQLKDRCSNALVCDRDLGPMLVPRMNERGTYAGRIAARMNAEETAEEARLLYVAATRARDRLVISGPSSKTEGVQQWLANHRDPDVRVTAEVPEVDIPPLPPETTLDWIGDITAASGDTTLVSPVTLSIIRRTRSATEFMTHRRSRAEWRMKYIHGVIPKWHFTGGAGSGNITAATRGTIVHGVLERIQDEAELADLLDLAIGTLDEPDLEERLSAGTEYRLELEREIRAVVASEEWRWYVDGEHYREIWFAHFRPSGRWRVGAFDLYRLDPERADLIVDFKTHDIASDAAPSTARSYRLQAAVYRTAATALAREPTVRLHFTRPNTIVEM